MHPPLMSSSYLCDFYSLSVRGTMRLHHHIMVRLYTVIFNFMCIVPFKYRSTHFSLPQSSSSELLTRLVRKDTSVCISGRARWLRKMSWPVVRWKACACSSGSNFLSSSGRTVNRWSAAGVGAVLVMGSEKSSMICLEYCLFGVN